MQTSTWSWSETLNPDLVAVLDRADHLEPWEDALESATKDPLTNKIACVCAALGVAKRAGALARSQTALEDSKCLELLAEWIDQPTEQRFQRISKEIFGPERAENHEPSVSDLVYWALRTATSSVDGCGEAAWALCEAFAAAEKVGLQRTDIVEAAVSELRARMDE